MTHGMYRNRPAGRRCAAKRCKRERIHPPHNTSPPRVLYTGAHNAHTQRTRATSCAATPPLFVRAARARARVPYIKARPRAVVLLSSITLFLFSPHKRAKLTLLDYHARTSMPLYVPTAQMAGSRTNPTLSRYIIRAPSALDLPVQLAVPGSLWEYISCM